MRAILRGAALAVAACGDLSTPTIPGLHGFVATAISNRPDRGVLARMGEWRAPDEDCIGNAYGGIAVTGDLDGAHGPHTVLASFDQVIVVDAAGALVAATPTELDCSGGSSPAIEIVALRPTWVAAPVIA